ncbi:putative nucleotide-binding protein [Thermoplasmatales archaeon]|nr:putative nucleotide-binding protein [Thermoplasmatales archaeon]
MKKKTSDLLRDLRDYLPEDWKKLVLDPIENKKKIERFAREIPAEVYEVVRDEIVSRLLAVDNPSLAVLEFVVDANIIMMDAFRVGSGKYSSTERIFSSVFVKLYAPKSIKDEVFTKIKEDLPKGCSLELALAQATKLLSKIELVDDSEFEIEYAGLTKFQAQYKNDVSFLKVGLGLGVRGIISRDKDFERDGLIKRFDLGTAAQMIVTSESGALSITLIGGAAYVGSKGIYWILYLIYKAIVELFGVIVAFTSAGVAGFASLIAKAPSWVWYVLLFALGGLAVSMILSEDLKDKTLDGIEKVYDWGANVAGKMLEVLTNLFRGATDIAVAFKDVFGQDFLNVGIGLLMTIVEMEEVLSED